MGMLARIASPADVRALSADELPVLAGEIRRFLIDKVSATGGHLGPNLGVVELTIALHRVFESPTDPIIWDTGHQSYVHKILTGRQAGFDRLRQRDGLSGYPDRAESPHDWTESSHASSSLSTADGLSKAFELTGADRTVVAVVGDGALTGGMCWEALNNITEGDRPVVIVVNDNGRSYAPTIGGLARHLSGLRLQPGYERALDEGRRIVEKVPVVGKAAFNVLHGMKSGLKEVLAPQTMFSDLGIKYVGPVDGHDLETLENALTLAKSFGGPVIVHAVTRKGMGYAPAENHEADQMHATGIIDPQTGLSTAAPAGADWTSVFADALVEAGERRSDVVAITAAMPGPTGLSAFADRFPDRMFDVGIAEQHAVASASGLALGGLHPVVAVYSTFLNRAFDQLLMDVALLDLPMTMVLDRSGVTGPDGASHNGMWDLSLLSIVPGIRVAAPRDAVRLREEFAEALEIGDGPSVVRFAKGTVPEDIPALTRLGDGVDVLIAGEGEPTRASGDVLIVAVGDFAGLAIDTAERLDRQGITATVVDPRWVFPVPASVVELAGRHRLVVTVEDSGVRGGAGSAVAEAVAEAGLQVPVQRHGIPQRFLRHASRGEILSEIGLTAPDLARSVTATVASMSGGPARLEGLADQAGR